MATKTTKRDYFNRLLSLSQVSADASLVEFINHELELLDKKNAARKAELSDTQVENMNLADKILSYMDDKADVTIKAIRDHFGISPQKATPIMNKLVKAGAITEYTEKRIRYFNLSEE